MEFAVTMFFHTRSGKRFDVKYPKGQSPDYLPGDGDKVLYQEQLYYVESTYFDFDRELIEVNCVEGGGGAL